MGAIGTMMLWEGKWVLYKPSREPDLEWWEMLYPGKSKAFHLRCERIHRHRMARLWGKYVHLACVHDVLPDRDGVLTAPPQRYYRF